MLRTPKAVDVCVTVTLLTVCAGTPAFHHSMNHRSVVFGRASIDDPDKVVALVAFSIMHSEGERCA